MFIYNEEAHALRVLRNKKFNTLRQQKQEKYALIKYLLSINKADEEINKTLKSIKNNQLSYLDKDYHNKINYSMINRAKNMKFIKDVSIEITKEELELMIGLQDSILSKLMYGILINYKYTKKYTTDFFISKRNNDRIFVKENEKEVLNLVGLSFYARNDIQKAYKMLLDEEYYFIQNFKGENYYTIPFLKESNNIAFSIKHFDSVLNELLYYDNPSKYFRCEVCGKLIERKAPDTNNKKYCSDCARYVKIQKTLESQKRRKRLIIQA